MFENRHSFMEGSNQFSGSFNEKTQDNFRNLLQSLREMRNGALENHESLEQKLQTELKLNEQFWPIAVQHHEKFLKFKVISSLILYVVERTQNLTLREEVLHKSHK